MRHVIPFLALICFAAAGAEHPRLFFTASDIPGIKARAQHPLLKPHAERLIKSAEEFLSAPPILVSLTKRGEPDVPGETKGIRSSRMLQSRVLTYCMAFTLSGDRRFRDAAVKELDHALTNWQIWVDTAHAPPYDLMTGETCFTFGLAYDWLYADLSPDERSRIKDGAERRGLRAYIDGAMKQMRWLNGINNWNTVCNGGATVLALSSEGESEVSAQALDFAIKGMKSFWNHLPEDGGWDEGTGYWHYGMRYAFMAAEALKRRGKDGGKEVFELPGAKRTPYFPIVFNPGTRLSASFGDVSYRANDAIFYLLGREYKNPDFIWFQDRAPVGEIGWPLDVFALLWRPVDEDWLPEKTPNFAPKFQGVYGFNSIGWGMMAAKQPDPPFLLAFKNGSLAASHTHLDLNHISVAVGDTMLLIDLGSRPYPADYFSGKRYSYYETSTVGHNTVLIGERGQTPGKKGKLLGPIYGSGYEAFVGVADGAYETASRVRRTVVFVNKRYYVLLDDVIASQPQSLELRFHTYGTVKTDSGTWTIEQDGASLALSSWTESFSGEIQNPDQWIKPVNVISLKSKSDAATFVQPSVIFPIIDGKAPPVKFEKSKSDRLRVSVGSDVINFSLGDDGWKVDSVEIGK